MKLRQTSCCVRDTADRERQATVATTAAAGEVEVEADLVAVCRNKAETACAARRLTVEAIVGVWSVRLMDFPAVSFRLQAEWRRESNLWNSESLEVPVSLRRSPLLEQSRRKLRYFSGLGLDSARNPTPPTDVSTSSCPAAGVSPTQPLSHRSILRRAPFRINTRRA